MSSFIMRMLLIGLYGYSALTPVSAADSEKQGFVLEEVIVTAQKRAESLQDTPISIVAFDAESLEKFGIDGLSDISDKVPNLAQTPFPFGNQTLRFVLRGIGPIDTQLTQDPGVGIYMDNVYVGRPLGIGIDVAELERIEVLRGPQGTLYGRNTIGGAVRLIPKKPDFENRTFKQKFNVGNRSYFRSTTSINMPITENFAGKFAYVKNMKDGFIDNLSAGPDFDDENGDAVRGDLSWKINDRFTADYSFDYSDVDDVSGPYQATNAAALPVPFSTGILNGLNAGPNFGENNYKSYGHSLTLSLDLTDTLILKSITALRDYEEFVFGDLSAGTTAPEAFFFMDQRGIEQDQFSQELQLTGDLNERLEIAFGLFYFTEDGDERAASAPQFVTAGGAFRRSINDHIRVENTSWAIYGQTTWTPPVFDDRIRLTVGARYTEDDREADRLLVQNDMFGAFALPTFTIDSEPSDKFTNFSPSIALAVAVTEDVNFYGKIVTGYKSGGFNTRAPNADEFGRGFDEEELTSYEVGLKGDFLDNRLRVNVAAFYADYEDIQLNVLVPNSNTTTNVFNAGEGHRSGLEVDISAVPFERLLLELSYAQLHADYDEVIQNGVDVAEQFVQVNVPRHSLTASADLALGEYTFGNLNANVNYSFTDDRRVSPRRVTSEPGTGFIEDYGLLNASMTLSDIDIGFGSLRLSVWGRNLTDKEYQRNVLGNFFGMPQVVLWAEPRTYGADIALDYDF